MSNKPTTRSHYTTLVKDLLQSYISHIETEKEYETKITATNLQLAKAIYKLISSPSVPDSEKAYRVIAKKLIPFQKITHTEVMNLYHAYKSLGKNKRGGVSR